MEVPANDFQIELGDAEIIQPGDDVTIVAWGAHLHTVQTAADMAAQDGISCEIIDLQTILPWDEETIMNSDIKNWKISNNT